MINTYTYGHLIYDKAGKTIQWGKTVSSISSPGKLDSYMLKKQKEIRKL